MDTAVHFNIGEAATRSGVTAKMVRHYESLCLLPTVSRTDSGYRQYTSKEVHTLRFIKRARDLGFSMAEIAELLKLWQNRRRSSADVRKIAARHVEELNQRMAEMDAMRRTLEHLVHCCNGDHRPDCPILDELEELESSQPAPARAGGKDRSAQCPPAQGSMGRHQLNTGRHRRTSAEALHSRPCLPPAHPR